MLASIAGVALLAGAGAASAQTFYADDYAYGVPGVGVQVGPVGAWVGAPVAGVGPGYGYGATYGYGSPDWNYSNATRWNSSAPRGGTYKMRAFKSQELLPQSPPEGGY
jgi:hypothetical protein